MTMTMYDYVWSIKVYLTLIYANAAVVFGVVDVVIVFDVLNIVVVVLIVVGGHIEFSRGL